MSDCDMDPGLRISFKKLEWSFPSRVTFTPESLLGVQGLQLEVEPGLTFAEFHPHLYLLPHQCFLFTPKARTACEHSGVTTHRSFYSAPRLPFRPLRTFKPSSSPASPRGFPGGWAWSCTTSGSFPGDSPCHSRRVLVSAHRSSPRGVWVPQGPQGGRDGREQMQP